MIRSISHYIESKTGVYVYPRFIISVLALILAGTFFLIVYTVIGRYTESIKTSGPGSDEARAKYDQRMKASARPSSIPE